MSLLEQDYTKRQNLYDQFLRCIDREENLIHYRMSWGMQWNIAAFASLFAAYELNNASKPLYFIFSSIIVLSAFFANWLTYNSVKAAHTQVEYLIESIERRIGARTELEWENSEFVRPYGEKTKIHMPARRASKYFPHIFSIIWGCVVVFLVSQWQLFFN